MQLRNIPFKGSQSLCSSFRIMLEARKRISQIHSPFLLHVAEPGALRAFLRFRWFLKPLPPYLITIHGSELLRFTGNRFECRLFRKTLAESKSIHVLSSFNRRSLLQFCPAAKDLIKMIPGAPARKVLPTMNQGEKSEETVNILCVGRIHPRKGQDKLINAVNQLPEHLRKKTRLCFVGPVVDQSFYRSLEQDAKRSGCEIMFLGELSDGELREQYERADVFGLTSMPRKDSIEGFGFVYLEAASHGLPVIAHDTGGVKDAVRHGRNGFLIDPDEPESLTERIGSLIKDENLRKEMGEKGVKWASSHSWDEVAMQLYSGI